MSRKYLSLTALKKKQTLAQKRTFALTPTQTLPSAGSVKNKVQEVYDQGQEGSCTANAFCAAYRILESDKSFIPSRQYVYWKERLIENSNSPSGITDSGADVEDAVTYVSKYGVCSEASWPYNVATVDVAPPASCDTEAASHTLGVLTTIQLGNLAAIKSSILNGIPVLLAIGVYQSFESATTAATGMVKIPKPVNFEDPNDPLDPFLGGHQVLIVGYTDSSSLFTVLNSWGTGWGKGGYFYLPYAYVTNPQLTYELCCIAPGPAATATATATATKIAPAETAQVTAEGGAAGVAGVETSKKHRRHRKTVTDTTSSKKKTSKSSGTDGKKRRRRVKKTTEQPISATTTVATSD